MSLRARKCSECGDGFVPSMPWQRRCGGAECVPRCSECGEQLASWQSTRCSGCYGNGRRVGGALVDSRTPYADDVAAQLFVATFPDGATLEDVGEAMGFSKERTRQIEALALRRLVARLRLVGIDEADIAEALALRARRDAW